MNRYLVLIVVISIIFMVGCNSDELNPGFNLGTLNLNGQVKSIEMHAESGFSGELISVSLHEMGFRYDGHVKMMFDNDGMMVEEIRSRTNGDVFYESVYTYDDHHLLTQMDEVHIGLNEDKRYFKTVYDQNNSGDAVIEDHSQRAKHIEVTDVERDTGMSLELTYDDQNRLIETYSKVQGKEAELHSSRSYNEEGLIEALSYYIEDEVTATVSFAYDGNKNMASMTVTNRGNDVVYTFEYLLDDQSNWIEQKVFLYDEHKYTVKRTIEYY